MWSNQTEVATAAALEADAMAMEEEPEDCTEPSTVEMPFLRVFFRKKKGLWPPANERFTLWWTNIAMENHHF